MSHLQVKIDGHKYDINLNLPAVNGEGFEVIVNGEAVRVQLPDTSQSGREMEWLIVNERPYEIVIDPDLHWIKAFSGIHRLEVRDQDTITHRPHNGDGRVKSPIPGLIANIRVQVGDRVEAGQPILVLEAMKMENEIRAPVRGVVTAVHVQPGQTVVGQMVLVEIE